MEIGVTIKEAKKAKKGKVEYFEPVFAAMPIKEETNQAAIAIDKELQDYLKIYLERNATSTETPKISADVNTQVANTTSKNETVQEVQSADINTGEEEDSLF